MHTDLHAAAINDVFQVVILVIDFIDNVAACPRVFNLANIHIFAIFNISHSHFGSVQTGVCAFAWSVKEQEWLIVEFFSLILKINLQ